MVKTRVMIFVSTKGILMQDHLNNALEKLEDDGYDITDVRTDISFAGKEGYQIIGTIVYREWISDGDKFEIPATSGYVDFCPGEPLPGSTTITT